VNRLNMPEMLLEWPNDLLRHDCDLVFVALPRANGYLTAFKVEILDPQAKCFEQSQAAAVQEHCDQPFVSSEARHDPRDLIDGQCDR